LPEGKNQNTPKTAKNKPKHAMGISCANQQRQENLQLGKKQIVTRPKTNKKAALNSFFHPDFSAKTTNNR
jgi:hypothetical protein